MIVAVSSSPAAPRAACTCSSETPSPAARRLARDSGRWSSASICQTVRRASSSWRAALLTAARCWLVSTMMALAPESLMFQAIWEGEEVSKIGTVTAPA